MSEKSEDAEADRKRDEWLLRALKTRPKHKPHKPKKERGGAEAPARPSDQRDI
jgi:hypothetical protein